MMPERKFHIQTLEDNQNVYRLNDYISEFFNSINQVGGVAALPTMELRNFVSLYGQKRTLYHALEEKFFNDPGYAATVLITDTPQFARSAFADELNQLVQMINAAPPGGKAHFAKIVKDELLIKYVAYYYLSTDYRGSKAKPHALWNFGQWIPNAVKELNQGGAGSGNVFTNIANVLGSIFGIPLGFINDIFGGGQVSSVSFGGSPFYQAGEEGMDIKNIVLIGAGATFLLMLLSKNKKKK